MENFSSDQISSNQGHEIQLEVLQYWEFQLRSVLWIYTSVPSWILYTCTTRELFTCIIWATAWYDITSHRLIHQYSLFLSQPQCSGPKWKCIFRAHRSEKRIFQKTKSQETSHSRHSVAVALENLQRMPLINQSQQHTPSRWILKMKIYFFKSKK